MLSDRPRSPVSMKRVFLDSFFHSDRRMPWILPHPAESPSASKARRGNRIVCHVSPLSVNQPPYQPSPLRKWSEQRSIAVGSVARTENSISVTPDRSSGMSTSHQQRSSTLARGPINRSPGPRCSTFAVARIEGPCSESHGRSALSPSKAPRDCHGPARAELARNSTTAMRDKHGIAGSLPCNLTPCKIGTCCLAFAHRFGGHQSPVADIT